MSIIIKGFAPYTNLYNLMIRLKKVNLYSLLLNEIAYKVISIEYIYKGFKKFQKTQLHVQ